MWPEGSSSAGRVHDDGASSGSAPVTRGCRGEPPRAGVVTVEVLDLDRAERRVDPDVAGLARRERGGQHGHDRVVGEPDHRGRRVLGLQVAVQPERAGVDLGPLAQQEPEQVELVDAEPEQRPAALASPTSRATAPRSSPPACGTRACGRRRRAAARACRRRAASARARRRSRCAAGTPPRTRDRPRGRPRAPSSRSASESTGGFSQTTCAPPRRAVIAWSLCRPGGVHRCTTSTRLGGEQVVEAVVPAGHARTCRRTRPARPGCGSATATTDASGSSASTGACACAIAPGPDDGDPQRALLRHVRAPLRLRRAARPR